MSNVRLKNSPLSLAWAAGIALSATTGCDAESLSAEGSRTNASIELSQHALSTNTAGAVDTMEAAAELRKHAPMLREAALGIEELTLQLSASTRAADQDLVRKLSTLLRSLGSQVQTLGAQTQESEQAAKALERMAQARLQSARVERQLEAAESKLTLSKAAEGTSPQTIQELLEKVARLRRELDAHDQLAKARLAEVLATTQLGLDAAALLRESYGPLASQARSIAASAKKAGGSPRALSSVFNSVELLLADLSSQHDELSDLLKQIVISTRGPIDFEASFHEQLFPQVNDLEEPIETAGQTSLRDAPSLRVLTYNAAFLTVNVDAPFPHPMIALDLNDGVFSGLNYVDRANKIADGILRGDQDVVVLNEVFSDEAREVLVNRLVGRYPNYVAKLAGVPLLRDIEMARLLAEFHTPAFTKLVDLVAAVDVPGFTDYLALPGDSGLMVFSKYPFLPLGLGPNDADCGDSACHWWGRNLANGGFLLPDEVIFDVYDRCSMDVDDKFVSADCLASKGVGLVKLDTPGIPSYVAFSHLQADDDVLEKEAPVRAEQYAQVEKVLSDAIPAAHLFNSRVFFVGDMNTPGKNRSVTSPSEWFNIYHPSTTGDACYACGNDGTACDYTQGPGQLFTDAWGFETSTLDQGLTQLNDRQRLDYILHNVMSGRACMQHAHIAYDVAEGGSHWYSDHLPLRADFNLTGDACSANDAAFSAAQKPRDLQFPSTNCDADPNTPAPPCQQTVTFVAPQARLANPGSFQWYRITQPGSYSIKIEDTVPGQRVAFEVYQGKDLSRPVQPFDTEDHPRRGKPFAMLEPPYYVRVFAVDANGKPDRSPAPASPAAGGRDYRIDIHQHLCRSPDDGCFLPAAMKHPYVWPEITGYSSVRELYFKFKTSGVKKGRLTPEASHYPMVRFQEESYADYNLDCLNPLELKEYDGVLLPTHVRDYAWQETATDNDNDWDDVDGPDIRFVAPDLDGDTPNDFKIYYVKMGRKNKPECAMPFPTNLRFETNLTYFRAGRAQCFAQYDDSGIGEDDHTRFHLFFDEPFVLDYNYCDNNFCHTAIFDEPRGDNWLANVPSLQGYFVDKLTLGMWEDDNGPDMLFNSWEDPFTPLHPWLTRRDASRFVTDNPNTEKADYSYLIQYMLCREKNGCDPLM